MNFIKGISFVNFSECRGHYYSDVSKQALLDAKEALGLTHVSLCFLAYQETAYSEEIDFEGPTTPTTQEVVEFVTYAKSIGLKVILKPMLDCKDGTWRAHINFFDIDEPCEPQWKNWFTNYQEYIVTYAKVAEESGCEMLVIGTEMIQTERRVSEWIQLIHEVRKVYSGKLTYNTDKYQEENVKWWNHLDVISASGYYPIGSIKKQMQRIELFLESYNMPYLFMECGCPTRLGASNNPNDWQYVGEYSEEEQALWWKVFLEETIDQPWLSGYTPWSWNYDMTKDTKKDDGYDLCDKLALPLLKKAYEKR